MSLLRGYLANFVKSEIINATDDLTNIDFSNKENQLPKRDLVIGTETLYIISEFEDDVEGTSLGIKFYASVGKFYETIVTKMLVKFPYNDKTLDDLAFLNPSNRVHCSIQSIGRLCKRFLTNNSEEIDKIIEEFLAYKVAKDNQLPPFYPNSESAIDSFWSLMASMKVVSSNNISNSFLAYSNLTNLSKILLVLPHSNADPERLFSMLGNIETECRTH